LVMDIVLLRSFGAQPRGTATLVDSMVK
jgi:hypothetical protein